MKLTSSLSCLVLVVTLAACASAPMKKIGGDPSNPMRVVAVLPFVNNTNDVEGPSLIQEAFTAGLYERYYEVMDPDDVNQILKDQMGVTLGVQLDLTTPQKLCEVLGVDGLLYGSLDDYNEKLTGAYNVRRVRVRTFLTDCKTGTVVWKNGVGIKSQFVQGGAGLEKAPALAAAVAAAGAIGAVGSKLSDLSEDELKPFLGERIPAQWMDLPPEKQYSSGNLYADIGTALVLTIAERAYGLKLARERGAAVIMTLDGYYHVECGCPPNKTGLRWGPEQE